jgi:hypothetical protein
VPSLDLRLLGIASLISDKSHRVPWAPFVLLDEGDDAMLYLEAARSAGWRVTVTDKQINAENVRSLRAYQANEPHPLVADLKRCGHTPWQFINVN